MMADSATVICRYLDAWRAGDLTLLRAVLADEVSFAGPLGHCENADEYCHAIERLVRITTEIDVHKVFADGRHVLAWFDLHTTVAPPCPIANWSQVRDGKISRVQVTFDPRQLAASLAQQDDS